MAASSVGGPATSVRPAAGADRYDETAGKGYGWVIFAGSMLAMVGSLNFIYGIAAISNSKFFVRDAQYVISDLNTWGWVLLSIGVIQFLAAFAIWTGSEIGRWIGIISAGLNAIAQMLAIPAYPFLALALFSVDILVIYGLAVYGGHKLRA
ncbi:MAG TPA: hypothetical protein VGJ70_23230 [Solirubrobacteraceae bacterium]